MVERFPTLNLLINSAVIMRKVNLLDRGNGTDDIGREIETNLTGTVRMAKQFLPHLKSPGILSDHEHLIRSGLCSAADLANLLCRKSRCAFLYAVSARPIQGYWDHGI